MKLINHKGTIYLEFISTSKIIKKSLSLPYTKQNLSYATKTLLPIFKKLYEIKKKKTITISKNINHKTASIQVKTKLLSHICQETLNDLKPHSKLTTQHTVIYAYKKVFDFLADQDIRTYTAHTIQTAIYQMKKSLSPKTIHLITTYLNLAFKKAMNLKLIKENPMLNLKKPRIVKSYKTLPSSKQINTLLSSAKGELKLFLYLAFYTGARSGELLALKKSDINLNNNTLIISKNQTRFELTTPKTGNHRVIPVPKNLSLFLSKTITNLKNENLFSSDYFKIYYKFKKLLKSLSLPLFGLHITRHCYATLLLNTNLSPMFIARNLGHSSLKEINHTYSHYIFDKKEIINLEKALNF